MGHPFLISRTLENTFRFKEGKNVYTNKVSMSFFYMNRIANVEEGHADFLDPESQNVCLSASLTSISDVFLKALLFLNVAFCKVLICLDCNRSQYQCNHPRHHLAVVYQINQDWPVTPPTYQDNTL